MSKKALATFTLAVAGAGFMPGASLAHATDAPQPSTWVLPSVSAADAQDENQTPQGAHFTVTVETRDSVGSAWKDVTSTQATDGSETKEQREDVLRQAQKLVGTPSTVRATTEEDALLRVTYKESGAPTNYWGNDDAVTLYEVSSGWIQGAAHSDAEKALSDQVKFTPASDDAAGTVKFINAAYQASSEKSDEGSSTEAATPEATASSTATATPSTSSSTASSTASPTAASTSTESVASETASAAPSTTATASATPEKATPSSTPTQAAHSLAVKSPLALPKTGMKAATSAYTIDGTVFTDTNKNGAFDSTEKAAPNRTVVLKNELDQSVVAMRTTDANGHYSFGSLQKGTYDVAVNPSGSSTTSSVWGNTSTDHAVVIINDTMNSSTVDFGVSGGTVKNKHELENGSASASPSASATSTPSATSTSTSTPTPSTSETPETSTATSTEVVPAPTNTDSSTEPQTVVNSGEVPNSVNGGALAAGVGFLGGSGFLARMGLRRKR